MCLFVPDIREKLMPALLTKITAFFTAIVMFFTELITVFYPRIPDAEPLSELERYSIAVKRDLPDEIYVTSSAGLSTEELHILVCLQGIVAKKSPCIFIEDNWAGSSDLADLEKTGKTLIRTDAEGNKWNLYSLIGKFSSFIADGGCVLWSESEFAYSLNVAADFASLYGWLPVTQKVLDKLGDGILTVKKDLTSEEDGPELQKKYYKQFKGKFNMGAVVHVSNRMYGMRDLAIQQGWYCFYTEADREGTDFLKKVLGDFGSGTHVLGWVENEKNCVKIISRAGCSICPMDFCRNTSYLSQIEIPVSAQKKTAVAHSDESKHYVCLLLSDGDNIQWLMNGYGEYYDKIRNCDDVNISWTFSPSLYEFDPFMHNRVYEAAGENNYFVSGPSGAAYANPSVFRKSALADFSKETAAAMLRTNQRIITVLDDYYPRSQADILYSLGWFSRYDNIDGGLLFLDPDRYEAGRGRIWFSNDKPFISTRLSLWNSDGYDGATDEWLKEQADIINGYPVDIHSVNGYSLICVHAWTMKTSSIRKFVDCLGDNVEILSAGDFIETISANVPHKNAVPVTAYQ